MGQYDSAMTYRSQDRRSVNEALGNLVTALQDYGVLNDGLRPFERLMRLRSLCCDNTMCEGDYDSVLELRNVEMKAEFEGGTVTWCLDCIARDGDSIAIMGDYDESDEWTEISAEVAEEFNEFIDLEDAQVDAPIRPEDCGHDETRRTVNQSGEVVHERCSDCYEVLVDRRGGDEV